MKRIDFFYDILSPYTWIGFEVMCRYAQKWKIDLRWKPFFLAGIMQASENQPPGFVPSKFIYMGHDLKRLAKHYHIPLKMAADPVGVLFKKGSLPTMRFVTAIANQEPDSLEEVSRQLWLRIWSRDEDITQPESLREAATAAGLSAVTIDRALTAMTSEEVKTALKAITAEAIEHQAFGSPTIVVHTEKGPKMVFGSDRFHIIADLLGEKYTGPLNELNKIKSKI